MSFVESADQDDRRLFEFEERPVWIGVATVATARLTYRERKHRPARVMGYEGHLFSSDEWLVEYEDGTSEVITGYRIGPTLDEPSDPALES